MPIQQWQTKLVITTEITKHSFGIITSTGASINNFSYYCTTLQQTLLKIRQLRLEKYYIWSSSELTELVLF